MNKRPQDIGKACRILLQQFLLAVEKRLFNGRNSQDLAPGIHLDKSADSQDEAGSHRTFGREFLVAHISSHQIDGKEIGRAHV